MSYPQQPGNSNDPSWPAPPPEQPAGYPERQPVSYPEQAYQPGGQAPGYQPGYPEAAYQPGYPVSGDPMGGQQAPPGYPPYGYPVVVASPPNNGMAIASMVVSIVGVLGLCGYGLGGYIGIVGAILGHISRKQIRERGEGGEGMALAGIIVGWIAGAIAVLATIAIVIFIVWATQQDPSGYE